MATSKEMRVGAFVLAGLIVAGIVIFLIGDEKRLFDAKVHYYTSFSDVQGLTPFGEMHIRHRGYLGIAPLPGAIANVCIVLHAAPGLAAPRVDQARVIADALREARRPRVQQDARRLARARREDDDARPNVVLAARRPVDVGDARGEAVWTDGDLARHRVGLDGEPLRRHRRR